MLGIRLRIGVFERSKVLVEFKILSLAFYIQLSSLKKAAELFRN
jgi:hypothetical protein